MRNLANSYIAANRLKEALELDEETVRLLKAKLGPNDPETLASMNNLANSYSTVRRYKEALQVNQEVCDRYRSLRGPEHPDTLVSMGNLAKSFSDLGRHDEARELLEKVVALEKTKLGNNHANTIQSIYSLAITNVKLGRYAVALSLHQEALALRKEKFGANNYQTLFSMWGVAGTLAKLGRTPEAVPIIDDCLQRAAGKDYRSDFFGLADIRMRYFEKKQDAAGCRTTAEMFEKVHRNDAASLYNAACMRAITSAVIRATDKSSTGAKQADEEAERAMAWLEKAVGGGFKNVANMKKDSDLVSLRDRPDFQRLVAELEAGKRNK